MLRPILGIVLLLGLLAFIPWGWPDGFSQPPVVMILLLGIAAVAALAIGRRRRRPPGAR